MASGPLAETRLTTPPVNLRPSVTLFSQPLPDEYIYLSRPVPRSHATIRFLHPAYDAEDNEFLELNAWDAEAGGLHYGLAHTACAIVANNRFDGYFSNERTPGRQVVGAVWNQILPFNREGYYFHVPENASPLRTSDSDCQSSSNPKPYKWPIVPGFRDWKFPRELPSVWAKLADQQILRPPVPQSSFTAAVHKRDITCRMSGYSTALEVAHLVPFHEQEWFSRNRMSHYNNDRTLDASNILRDQNNAILLRADLHQAFDHRRFAFFPKNESSFVVHILEHTPDLGPLFHNTQVDICKASIEFLFARFAWSIFPSIAPFLASPPNTRLIVRCGNATRESIIEEATPTWLAARSAESRSNSPTKVAKRKASANDTGDAATSNQRPIRKIKVSHAYAGAESDKATTISNTHSLPLLPQLCHDSSDADAGLEPDSHDLSSIEDEDAEASRIDNLRSQALAQQRPKDYQRPAYDKRRPAREELEAMGMEIIGDNDDDVEIVPNSFTLT